MSTYLVTGGNGFVAAQVLISGLTKGHSIVATTRSQDKADQTVKSLSKYLSSEQLKKLEWAIVKDIGAPDAFDDVLQKHKFDAVLHTATPFHYNVKSPYELLNPAIDSTKSILDAVSRLAPSVKRVIVTSSFASIVNLNAPNNGAGLVYSEANWNPITWEAATAGDPGQAYYGAKKFAEKAAWDYVEEKKPHFELITLCPPFVFGQVASPVDSLKNLNTSSAFIQSYINGQLKDKEIPGQQIFIWVDVTDLGEAHIIAAERPGVGNKRFLLTAGNFSHKEIGDNLRELAPEHKDNIPTKLLPGLDPSTGYPEVGYFKADNSRSKNELGINYKSLKESLARYLESVKDVPE